MTGDNIYSLGLIALSAFLLALIFTPIVRDWFLSRGLVDQPDGVRKAHKAWVPRAGGIAICLAYLGSYALPAALHLGGWTAIHLDFGVVKGILPAAAVVFAIGLLDDLKTLKPWVKLAGQVAAALIAFAGGGIRLQILHWHPIHSWWWSLPLTVFWLVLCTNAFNLIDGMDGLSSGLGLFATLTLVCAALLQHNWALLLATIPLAGALLGFLRFNFNPASIFLGDCGSYTVGFLLGCFGILWTQKSATLLGLTAPLLALAVPLMDVTLAVVRRFLRSKPIFGADRLHIHHRLLDRGLTPRRAVLVLYGAGGLAAGLSLLSTMLHDEYAGLILVLFCGAAWLGVQHLGYAEINTAGRMVLQGAFRRALQSEILVRAARERLDRAETPDTYWDALRTSASEMGFCRVALHIEGQEFGTCFEEEVDPLCTWSISIPLERNGYAELVRRFDKPMCGEVARFADALRSRAVRGWATRGALPARPQRAPLLGVLRHRLSHR
jgi:UDP-GlcNAc:undecaprenyl-phosphate GlcNAc-1-phosphate transferase